MQNLFLIKVRNQSVVEEVLINTLENNFLRQSQYRQIKKSYHNDKKYINLYQVVS